MSRELPGPGAVDEMLRVLSKPGYLVFGLPNHGSLWTPIEDAIRAMEVKSRVIMSHDQQFVLIKDMSRWQY